jgi:hypothetical protein
LRTIPVLIAACLFALPAHAKYSGGNGTAQDPYQIATAADLIALGETPEDYDKHFILTADIDLDPNLRGRKVFDRAVIASGDLQWIERARFFQGTPFTGTFDGGGHTITHLTIAGVGGLGLFGQLGSGAEVKDLGVVDVNVRGHVEVGGLVGRNGAPYYQAGGVVTRCYSTGVVSGTANSVGGLVGSNAGNVTQCYSSCAVSGPSQVGGLVGWNGDGTVANCYSTGAVSGTGDSVGWLVGENCSMVSQCYSAGLVSSAENAGGLVGKSWSDSVVSHSVWDMERSGVLGSAGGIGLTKAEMVDPQVFGLNGFTDDPNWVLDAGRDYPRLAWQGTPGQIIPKPDITWLEGVGTAKTPYRVDTADQLILLSKASILWDKHFVVGADIDLDPNSLRRNVFAQAVIQIFSGVFDGNGHTISHLTIRGVRNLGLFGQLASAGQVKNLGLVDVNVIASGDCVGGLVGDNNRGTLIGCYSAGTVTGGSGLVGRNSGMVTRCHSTVMVSGGSGLVGSNEAGGILTQCHSTGAVSGNLSVGGLVGSSRYGAMTHCYSTGAVTGVAEVGGLVGTNWEGTVTDCHSTGTVSGIDSVGGLLGENFFGVMTQCYSTGTVSGTHGVGGLVGDNCGEGEADTVIQCYSTGTVVGSDRVGGLVGENIGGVIRDCYSTGSVLGRDCVGGLVGSCSGISNDWYHPAYVSYSYSAGRVMGDAEVGGLVGGGEGEFTACRWDVQTTGRTTSAGGIGKTTGEMKMAKTFLDAGWDFVGETANGTEDIWRILEGKDYPRLWWEAHN